MNYSNYMDVQQEVKLVEKELVDLIIEHLKVNRIAVDVARQQAKDFLSLLPIQDQRDLLNKLKGLSERYEEAKEVYAEELGKINEALRQQTLNQMRQHIQTGNMDAAIAAAKAMYPEKSTEGEHAHPVGLEHTSAPLPTPPVPVAKPEEQAPVAQPAVQPSVQPPVASSVPQSTTAAPVQSEPVSAQPQPTQPVTPPVSPQPVEPVSPVTQPNPAPQQQVTDMQKGGE